MWGVRVCGGCRGVYVCVCMWSKFLYVDWTGGTMIVNDELGLTKYNEQSFRGIFKTISQH